MSSQSPIWIGLGEADITPPFPCKMAGFGLARTETHTGVHDPLAVRCALFDNGTERLALASVELIGLKGEVIRKIREALPAELGLGGGRLIMTCTHTHGGPVVEGDYVPFLVRKICEAVVASHADLRPGRIGGGLASHDEWLGFNRRRLEEGFLPVDREIPFLTVSESDGSLRALLFHYACHPSILGPDNLEITADWPGYTRRELQSQLGNSLQVFYLKGTEGDINTGYSAGLSSLGVKIPTRHHGTAERVGGVIARSILESLKDAREFVDPVLRLSTLEETLRFRSPDDLPASRARVAFWEKEAARLKKEGLREDQIMAATVESTFAKFEVAALESNAGEADDHKQIEQTVFRIGDAGFLTFPGEFFVESGLETKRLSRASLTFPLGISHDYLGYFPTRQAFEEGGYEPACARFEASTADDWTRRGVERLNGLF